MTGDDSARYRLRLAERSLSSARENLSRAEFRDAALFARAAVEHAAKSILACFVAVPRTHEPGYVLRLALESDTFPEALRSRATELAATFDDYGITEHILLSYGDEEHHTDPWSLVTEPRAKRHVDTAATAVDLANRCISALFGSSTAGA